MFGYHWLAVHITSKMFFLYKTLSLESVLNLFWTSWNIRMACNGQELKDVSTTQTSCNSSCNDNNLNLNKQKLLKPREKFFSPGSTSGRRIAARVWGIIIHVATRTSTEHYASHSRLATSSLATNNATNTIQHVVCLILIFD